MQSATTTANTFMMDWEGKFELFVDTSRKLDGCNRIQWLVDGGHWPALSDFPAFIDCSFFVVLYFTFILLWFHSGWVKQ